jgi:hypothetical protein
LNGALNFVDSDTMSHEPVWIRLDAYGIFLRAENLHAGNAADGGDALSKSRFRVFIDRVERKRAGVQRKIENRLL